MKILAHKIEFAKDQLVDLRQKKEDFISLILSLKNSEEKMDEQTKELLIFANEQDIESLEVQIEHFENLFDTLINQI